MTKAEDVPPELRQTIERYIGDRERCMPFERKRWEEMGFVAQERQHYGPECTSKESRDDTNT